MTLREMADMIGVSSPSTVNAWEDGQSIPGPAQLLLRMLIHGELPFAEPDAGAEAMELAHFWNLRLTLADWHKLEALATAGGFSTVRDYLLSIIQEHLAEIQQPATRTADHGKPDDLALVEETTLDDVSGHLGAAAEAFAAQHPLPAGEAGGSAGTDSGRRPKKLRHNQTPEHAEA